MMQLLLLMQLDLALDATLAFDATLIIKKNFYERRDYESVDEKSLS